MNERPTIQSLYDADQRLFVDDNRGAQLSEFPGHPNVLAKKSKTTHPLAFFFEANTLLYLNSLQYQEGAMPCAQLYDYDADSEIMLMEKIEGHILGDYFPGLAPYRNAVQKANGEIIEAPDKSLRTTMQVGYAYLEGLQSLHDGGVVHMTPHYRNAIFNGKKMRFVGFSHSRMAGDTESLTDVLGGPNNVFPNPPISGDLPHRRWWRAPEQDTEHERMNGLAVDNYYASAMLLSLFTDFTKLQGLNETKQFTQETFKEFIERFDFSHEGEDGEKIRNLLLTMMPNLHENPEERNVSLEKIMGIMELEFGHLLQ